MPIICKGVCKKYKAKKPSKNGRYGAGQKRCNSCGIFLYWDGFWCPCCCYRLRMAPRNSKLRQKLQLIKIENRGSK